MERFDMADADTQPDGNIVIPLNHHDLAHTPQPVGIILF
jgi:hypothetical protein